MKSTHKKLRKGLVFVSPKILSCKRVLVVEDEILVALLIEDFLLDLGCIVVGTYSTVADALEAVKSEAFDLAVLDVNLNGEMSYPVAEALAQQGSPFLFMSGYGDGALPCHPDWMVCGKPFKEEEFATMLSKALTRPMSPA